MQFEMIRHNWPEIAGFDLDKPLGRAHYVFVHFLTPVEFKLREEWLSLNAGDLIVVEPHVPHRIVSQQPMINDWMHVYSNIGEQMARFGLQVNTVYHMEQKQQITSRIARLEAEFFARDAHWEACAEALMNELWIAICRQFRQETGLPWKMEQGSGRGGMKRRRPGGDCGKRYRKGRCVATEALFGAG